MRWFHRKEQGRSLEGQLQEFARMGLTVNWDEGVTKDDLFLFHDQQELEKEPFSRLAGALSCTIEREPWTPLCDPIWSCDTECVEGSGSYVAVLQRLDRMTRGVLGIEELRDHVDQFDQNEQFEAWVSFQHRGKTIHWNMEVNDDWLDTTVLTCFDSLLEAQGTAVRLFAATDQEHYGQVVFLVALPNRARKRFSKLTGIELGPIR